ncbi:MAG: type II toxin-antitoxin system VapC family toxin [Anaerolineae bacterium]|jgi:predicted nucleic acid-binding protein|nr:type II toxin-antitoxin system VapC family toxin [Anaerolineae bacterium]MDH7474462.1 type II toxin-antitoxin system VapC family toxin [Anaerolineae bacterium]
MVVIDASVVLKGFFPDEEGHAEAQAIIRAYAQEEIELLAPTLLPYEVVNAILQAVRRDRIHPEKGQEILSAFEELGIPTAAVSWQRAWELAYAYDRSAYDGACLALAEETGSKLVTGDRRLYNAVRDRLPWVLWIEDYVSGSTAAVSEVSH